MLLLWLLWQLFGAGEVFDCVARDGVLVWGNTMTFGVEHRELQCYVGWFA